MSVVGERGRTSHSARWRVVGAAPVRGTLGVVAAVLVGTVAAVLALSTGPDAAAIGGVEGVASASASWLASVATALPLGYAFGAGMVAAVNPCGFALLPAYLALYVGQGDGPGPGGWARTVQAIRVSATMTLGFVLLFGLAGVALSVAAASLARLFPWLGLSVGVLLLLAGGRQLAGDLPTTSLGERLAERFGGGAERGGVRGYLAFGLAYGAASLSCTLPVFLAVVGSAVALDGPADAAAQFLLYSLGMGSVITALTLAVALVDAAAVRRVRALARLVHPASALLLLLAGGFIVYYWLTLGDLLGRA